MQLNAALFEQSARCGYHLKPRILWDATHPLYMRFNSSAKEFPGVCALLIDITVHCALKREGY